MRYVFTSMLQLRINTTLISTPFGVVGRARKRKLYIPAMCPALSFDIAIGTACRIASNQVSERVFGSSKVDNANQAEDDDRGEACRKTRPENVPLVPKQTPAKAIDDANGGIQAIKNTPALRHYLT